jgi:2-polyprenyl-3-methyl-5-hydroxy-6-metoxy-1,4-benzoquinol methylase
MATNYSEGGSVLSLKGESLKDYLKRKRSTLINNQVELAKKYLNLASGKKILEVGCFHGLFTQIINKETRAHCIGIDTNLLIRGKNLIEYDGKKMPFKKDYFDAFVSFEVLEHMSEAEQTIKELNRVLKAGAEGIISTPNKFMISSFNSGHNSLIGHIKQIIGYKQECVKLFSYGEILRLFERNNFSCTLLSNKPFWVKRGFIFLIKKNKNL